MHIYRHVEELTTASTWLHIHTYIYAHTQTCRGAQSASTWLHMHTNRHICTYTDTWRNSQLPVHDCILIHTYIHTNIYAHTQTSGGTQAASTWFLTFKIWNWYQKEDFKFYRRYNRRFKTGLIVCVLWEYVCSHMWICVYPCMRSWHISNFTGVLIEDLRQVW